MLGRLGRGPGREAVVVRVNGFAMWDGTRLVKPPVTVPAGFRRFRRERGPNRGGGDFGPGAGAPSRSASLFPQGNIALWDGSQWAALGQGLSLQNESGGLRPVSIAAVALQGPRVPL